MTEWQATFIFPVTDVSSPEGVVSSALPPRRLRLVRVSRSSGASAHHVWISQPYDDCKHHIPLTRGFALPQVGGEFRCFIMSLKRSLDLLPQTPQNGTSITSARPEQMRERQDHKGTNNYLLLFTTHRHFLIMSRAWSEHKASSLSLTKQTVSLFATEAMAAGFVLAGSVAGPTFASLMQWRTPSCRFTRTRFRNTLPRTSPSCAEHWTPLDFWTSQN